jgi:fatty-acyl-CoA synthase
VLVGGLTPAEFEAFLDAQPDLGTKSRPRFVRLVESLPRTATNKVLKRELRAEGVAGVTWVREERGTSYS